MKINTNLYEKRGSILTLKEGVTPPQGEVILLLEDVVTGEITEEFYKNIFVTAGKASLAARQVGQDKGQITYCAVGTGSTSGGDTPAVGNTQLVTELARKLISVRSVAGAIASFQTFFNTSEANGSLTEAGLFGDDATAVADSGTLNARTAISRVKVNTQTLTLLWAVTHN